MDGPLYALVDNTYFRAMWPFDTISILTTKLEETVRTMMISMAELRIMRVCVQALARNRKMLYITGMKLQWFQWWDFQNFQSQIIPDIPDSLCIVSLLRKLEEVKFDSIIGWYFPPKNCQIGIFFNYKNPFVNNIYLSYKYISEFTIVKCNRKFLCVFLLLLQRWRMLKLEKFL